MDLAVSPGLVYRHQPTAEYDLVGTVQTVTFEEVSPECTAFMVDPEVLPFGLLEGVTVGGGHETGCRYCLLLSKEAGNRQSAWVPLGTRVSVMEADMAANDDARHADLAAVWHKCGHDMRFRMMACAGVANVSILLSGPVPRGALTVTFQGANAIPRGVSLPQAVAAVADKKPLAFLMGPIRMKKRLAGAVQAMKDAL